MKTNLIACSKRFFYSRSALVEVATAFNFQAIQSKQMNSIIVWMAGLTIIPSIGKILYRYFCSINRIKFGEADLRIIFNNSVLCIGKYFCIRHTNFSTIISVRFSKLSTGNVDVMQSHGLKQDRRVPRDRQIDTYNSKVSDTKVQCWKTTQIEVVLLEIYILGWLNSTL